MTLVDKTMNLQAQSVDKSPILQGRASMTDREAFEAHIAETSWFKVMSLAKDDDDDGASVYRMCRMAAREAWQASRQQALEEAAQRIESHKTGASLDLVVQGFANEVRSLTTTGDKA